MRALVRSGTAQTWQNNGKQDLTLTFIRNLPYS